MDNSSQQLRIEFLKEFVFRIIQTKIKSFPIEEQTKEENIPQIQIKQEEAKVQIPTQIPPVIQIQKAEIKEKKLGMPVRPMIIRPIEKYVPQQRPSLPIIRKMGLPIIPELRKLNTILEDSAVLSIECPGSEKPIIVNRSGAVKTSDITLTKEEIDSILKLFSEKTKIPIISGVFKAIYGSFILTAITSEFVETKFILQKRMPNALH